MTRYIAILAILVVMMMPVFWMVSTSIKDPSEWYTPSLLPSKPTIKNYLWLISPESRTAEGSGSFQVAGKETMWKPLLNSLINAGLGTLLSIFAGLSAAYSMSRYKTGGTFLPFFILTLRMIPPVIVMIPITILFSLMGLYDTHLGMILLYALFGVPFVVLIMKSFFDDIPIEIDQAAMMDGYSPLGAFAKVISPMVKPGIVVTAIFVFIINWSDFIGALLLTQFNAYTLPVYLGKIMTGYAGTLYGLLTALGVIATAPLVIIGYLIQKHLVRGLTFGAIKRG
jgi:multiple sugar transport system permease protein